MGVVAFVPVGGGHVLFSSVFCPLQGLQRIAGIVTQELRTDAGICLLSAIPAPLGYSSAYPY